MKKRLLGAASFFAALLIIFTCAFCAYPSIVARAAEDEDTGWFYDQLATDQSCGIYETLEDMYESGDLETGTDTVDLISAGVLENREYSQSVLTADFSAARDAFFLDHASVFYVDRDLLSIRQLAGSDGYSITLGIGREDNYFYEGFDESNVDEAVEEYEAKVEEIAASCEGETRYETVHSVFAYISSNVKYALEDTASAGNEYFVRTAYGAAVKGEACCEGFSRAFKAVLDELGIPCVLVQGTFVGTDDDGNSLSQAHMWTYVRMDDNRWYLCDPTMQEASSYSDKYFLVCGSNDLMCCYQADGVISVGEGSYEFYYPMLSYMEYSEISSSNFYIVEDEDDANFVRVSYRGQNLTESAANGEYMLLSSDSGSSWWYVSGLLFDVDVSQYDYDGYLRYRTNGYEYTFAVTSINPSEGSDEYGRFNGDASDIVEVSYTVGEYKAATRLIATGSSATCDGEYVSTRLSPDKTYTVTVRFSENLTKIYSDEEVAVYFIENSYVTASDVNVKDVSYSGNEVTFTFTTKQTYHSSLMYYFEIEGLMGLESKLAPDPVGFAVVNNPVFSCPYVEGDYNQIYASTPVLILDGDTSDIDFTDEEGNSVSGSVSNKFSLVVSTPSETETSAMLDEITDEILSYAVYDISLGLCDKQVQWVTGERVKVYIPFPEGYSYDSVLSGEATFKAYHYDDEGNATEIECVVTETGLIIYCDSFSPFAIIATTPTGEEPKNAAVMTSGQGDVTAEEEKCDIVSLEAGESVSLTISPKEGYVVDRVTVNGEDVEFEKTGFTLTIKYEDLEAAGNVVEVTFAAASVVEAEEEAGYAVIHPEVDGQIPSEGSSESEDAGSGDATPGGTTEDESIGPDEGATPEEDESSTVDGESSGIPAYGIVLIVVAAVIVIALLAVALVILTRNGKKKEGDEDGSSKD